MKFLKFGTAPLLCLALMAMGNAYAESEDSPTGIDLDGWRGTRKPVPATFQPADGQARQCLILDAPGKWHTTTNLNWGQAARLLVCFHASAQGSATLSFQSGRGVLRHMFTFTAGEQVKTIPLKVFAREGLGADWGAINGVTLELAKPGHFKLLGIQAGPDTRNVPDDGRLYLATTVSPFNAGGSLS